MKPFPRISERLFCQPWNMLPDAYADLVRQFHDHRLNPKDRADDVAGPKWSDGTPVVEQVQVVGPIAILPVHGIIGKHLDWLEMWCGGVDLNTVCEQAKNIAGDPFVKTVVVDLRTPGGCGTGLAECADTLRDMSRAGKKVVAYADYQCCSAGYWLAAACDEIWAAPSARIGSISTYIGGLDMSGAYAQAGFEVQFFRDGVVKGVGFPGKEWTPEEKAYMQSVVEMHGSKFKGFIRERRGIADADMQGQWWEAGMAPKGVVDGFARDLQDLLAELI